MQAADHADQQADQDSADQGQNKIADEKPQWQTKEGHQE